MYYVYVLKTDEGPYIGYSANLKHRIGQHKRARQKADLVYYEAYLTEELACERELQLKQYGGSWRLLRKRLLL
jgi:predicted GIY-YIG superfamily endonuclease